MTNADDAILANSAITLTLLDKLIRKNAITRADGEAIMDTAARKCDAYSKAAAEMVLAAKAEMLRNH